MQFLLKSRILAERLYERGEGVLDGEVHFLLKRAEVPGREAGVDPWAVILEVEVGGPDQEVVGAVTVKGRKPGRRAGEVLAKRFNVGRLRRYDAPSEHADPLG